MNERLAQRPDCRAIGARPARLAAWPDSRAAELAHCDQQGKGGDGGYAGNAGEDGGAISEARVGFDDLEDRRFDSGHLPIDLFEALSVLTFQQRERQNLSAVLGDGAALLRSRPRPKSFGESRAAGLRRRRAERRSRAQGG